jgi:pentatricopeptide repeat protein
MRSAPIHRPGIIALALASLVAAGAARAEGGGRDDTTPTCPRGQVWDSRTQRCVQAQSGVLPDNAFADYAYALAKAERYDEALAVLDLMQDRETPQALNYRGYATRKLGRVDEGIGYYLKAVSLDPHYAQVREYLGEAYVIKGEVERAREQLRAIETICGTGCEEYEDLAKAIAEGAPG